MEITLPVFISLAPKVALTLLIVVAVFIGIEIYTMLGYKLPALRKSDKDKKTEDLPMKPLHFPEVTVSHTGKLQHLKLNKWQRLIILISSIILLSLLVLGGTFFLTEGKFSFSVPVNSLIPTQDKPTTPFAEPTQESSASPTVQTINYNARIFLYHEVDGNEWTSLTEEELSSLIPGDTVKIAIKTDVPANKIDITVNEVPVTLSTELTPEGYPFALYTIIQSRTKYKVAARVY